MLAYALNQLLWANVGFVLLFCIVRRYFDPLTSALAVVGAACGTGLLRYTAADLLMSQAAAFFSLTWCLFESLRSRSQPGARTGWFRLGAASVLVPMVRSQNVVFLLVPAVAVAESVLRNRRDRRHEDVRVRAEQGMQRRRARPHRAHHEQIRPDPDRHRAHLPPPHTLPEGQHLAFAGLDLAFEGIAAADQIARQPAGNVAGRTGEAADPEQGPAASEPFNRKAKS